MGRASFSMISRWLGKMGVHGAHLIQVWGRKDMHKVSKGRGQKGGVASRWLCIPISLFVKNTVDALDCTAYRHMTYTACR